MDSTLLSPATPSPAPLWHVWETGQGPDVVILHGVFGSGDNWLSLARRLEHRYRVFLPDQRNHGKSFHSDDFGYDLLADDLRQWMDRRNLDKIHLVGHSMGGKAAMRFAALHPSRLYSLTVVDIAPKAYALDHHAKMLAAMQDLDLSACLSRGDLDAALRDDIPELSTRMFVLKNIERDEHGRFRWRIALGPLSLSLSSIGKALPPHPPLDVPALLVRGQKSNYVTDEDWGTFLERFPNAEFQTVPGAGHWVHADAPDTLLPIVAQFLDQHSPKF
jgi:pimeloyl-ACP methyl ester carboxylesterase